MASALGSTLLASPAAAHDGGTFYIYDKRIDQVGAEFWSNSQFYMGTASFYLYSANPIYAYTLQNKVTVWTTSAGPSDGSTISSARQGSLARSELSTS